MSRPLTLILTVAATTLLGAYGLVSARSASSPDPEITRHLSVELGDVPAGAGTATAHILLQPDRFNEATLFAGDAKTRSLCIGGVNAAAPGATSGVPHDERPLVAWKIEARLVSADGDSAAIDVRWRRTPLTAELEPSSSHEGLFRWTVREGASAVLDLVRQADPPEARCESRSVKMQFVLAGDFELHGAAIGYDMWLVQRLPSGAIRTHHMHTTGQQGEDVSFFFPQVAIDVPALAGGGGEPILDVSVRGRVRGRVRRDGRIDLSVDASRWVQPRGIGLSSGTYGRTRLTVGAEETVEFEPPQHTGGWNTVKYDDVFRDARTAIRVRATRMW